MNRGIGSDTRFPSICKFKNIPYSIEELKDILESYPRKMPKLIVFDDYLDDVGQILKHFFYRFDSSLQLLHHFFMSKSI